MIKQFNTNNKMSTKKEVTAKLSKKEFAEKKENILTKCEHVGIIDAHLNEIKNTKNETELNEVLHSNSDLRAFLVE